MRWSRARSRSGSCVPSPSLYGDGALTPQVLAGGRRGFVLRTGHQDAPRLWTIEPQVQIDARFRGPARKRIDFLLTPVGRAGSRPLVIEMDGLEYHAGTVAQDLLDRMTMIRSGQVESGPSPGRTWTRRTRQLPESAFGTRPWGGEGRASWEGTRASDVSRPWPTRYGRSRPSSSLDALRRLLDGGDGRRARRSDPS